MANSGPIFHSGFTVRPSRTSRIDSLRFQLALPATFQTEIWRTRGPPLHLPIRSNRPLPAVHAGGEKRRRIWKDCRPLVSGRVTRKALALLKQIKVEREVSDEELQHILKKYSVSSRNLSKSF